ncbi:MAG: TonB-dependent receptor [Rhizobacter sp.]|nr:TonB-dependent receptor [Ferruginibacter sp.]
MKKQICNQRRIIKSKGHRSYVSKIILLISMSLPFLTFSQKTITGKVFDASGKQPLAAASIVAKGGTTMTGNDGSFSINGSGTMKSFVVSYAGYITQTIIINNAVTHYSIALQRLQELAGVTMIGSRNLARTKVQTPVPVDVIPVAAMAMQVGQTDLNQLLTFAAPSFHSGRQTVADGTDHIDPAQLRGLGSDQVLVLINGKRRHQSALVNVNGTVNRGQVGTDLNSIPIAAIESVEVLRDGAAAQYGSDAIAGVINIVLKKNTNALSGSISYGENLTSYTKDYELGKLRNTPVKNVSVKDGGNFQAGLNYGFKVGTKGLMNITGEYTLRESSNRAGTYSGQVFANVNGVNKDDSILNARSLTRNDFDMRIGNSKIASGALLLNADIALGTNWNLKVFGGYSQKNGEAAGFFRYPTSISSGAVIYATQVFSVYPNGFLPFIKTDIKDYSLSAGLEGKLGKWHAGLSNTIGINNFDFNVDNSVNYTRYAVSANAQTKFNAGGLNFLQNTVNADLNRNFNVLSGLNVAYGAEFRIDQYAQRAGEEASYKNYNTAAGAASGAQVFAGFVPDYAKTHSRSNVGLYVDLEQDFTKNLLLEFALRFENYSDFGSTLNHKVATRYKLGNIFTVRAAASTGFRAPSMQQKFYAKTNTLFVPTPTGLVPTESGTFTNDSKPAEILGIPSLKEERSQNYSVGFTTIPERGLEITVDGYWINIKDRIVLTNNFNGGTSVALAQLLKDNGATTANFFTNAVDTRAKGIEAVVNYSSSFSKLHKLRFTLAATFIKNEVKKGADGKPVVKASDTLNNSGQLGNYFNREDQSRIEVANPNSKASFSTNYNYKKLGIMLRFTYFGKVSYLDPTINPSNPVSFPVNLYTGQKQTLDQEFSGKTITDLSFSYKLTKIFTFTAGANNLFDVYQDKHTHSSNVSSGRFIYSRRVQQMGFNGRNVFARMSFNFNNPSGHVGTK